MHQGWFPVCLQVSSRRKATAFQQALLEIEEQEERAYRHIQTQMQKKQVHPAVSFIACE